MNFCKTRDVKSPTRGTPLSAGIDLYVPNDWMMGEKQPDGCGLWETHDGSIRVDVPPGEKVIIPSGIRFNVPQGHALIAFNKSGVAVKKGLQVGACVVDEDYTGEVQLHLTNVGRSTVSIVPGEKLVQFILLPVSYSDPTEVDEAYCFAGKVTERGDGKFGSTDHK